MGGQLLPARRGCALHRRRPAVGPLRASSPRPDRDRRVRGDLLPLRDRAGRRFGEVWLITTRAMQGASAAIMVPAAVGIVVQSFEVARRGRAMAIFFAVTGAMTAIGPSPAAT